jgi:hypothetical protein
MSVKFHQKGKLEGQKWIDSGALQNAKLRKKNSKNGQISTFDFQCVSMYREG